MDAVAQFNDVGESEAQTGASSVEPFVICLPCRRQHDNVDKILLLGNGAEVHSLGP